MENIKTPRKVITTFQNGIGLILVPIFIYYYRDIMEWVITISTESPLYFYTSSLLLIVILFSFTFFHEYLHVWSARKLGYSAEADVKNSVTTFEEPIKSKQHFIRILMAPCIYQGVFVVLFCLIFYQNTIVLMLIPFHILCCSGDFYMFCRALKINDSSSVFVYADRGEFLVQKSGNSLK